MLEHDDESTTFEPNPLGNRQRLKPRDSFLARNQKPVIEEPTAAVCGSMIVDEHTYDEGLVDHTMSDVVLPATSAVVLPAIAIATPVPTLSPVQELLAPAFPPAAALMLLPKEIAYPEYATPYYPPTESHTALPIASRRVRYLAVPAIAMLALVLLGGAAMPPEVESMAAPVVNVSAQESTGLPHSDAIASEPPAPAEIVEQVAPVKRVVRHPAKRMVQRKVTVNTSSALGNLRPRKAW